MSRFADYEREFFASQLDSFLPDRVFDAHTHLWRKEFVEWSVPGGPDDVGYPEHCELMQDLHPGRHTAGLFLPSVALGGDGSFRRQNEWVAQAVAAASDCRGMFFVRPEDDPEWVRQEVKRLGLHGLKCYHTMASVKPTWEAEIPDYLPEPLVKVAGEESWAITLHMVKSRAAADPGNIHWIRHYCETYPNMRLILAHSARGFQPAHNLEGLPQLAGLDNLYCDTSVNCEPMAHQAIIRFLGHDKLMYGTDLPVCHGRGRSVGVADTFLWRRGAAGLGGEAPDHPAAGDRPGAPALLKWACWLGEETPVWEEKHQTIQPLGDRPGAPAGSIKWAWRGAGGSASGTPRSRTSSGTTRRGCSASRTDGEAWRR